MSKKIFIACDVNKTSFVKKIIKSSNTKKLKIGYKFGLEFINSKNGRHFISKIKNKIIFADLKLNDIPNVGVLVQKAKGEKCSRCWKILGNPCERCRGVLKNQT